MRDHADKPIEEVADAISNSLGDFRETARQDDDITFVLLKMTGVAVETASA